VQRAREIAAQPEDAAPGAIMAARNKPLSAVQEEFARQVVLVRNATVAYIDTHDVSNMARESVRIAAYRLRNLPHVARRIDELQAASAQAVNLDIQMLLLQDYELVQAAAAAPELSSYVWHCCRYCHGVGHAYQWIDAAEYGTVLAKIIDENEERRNKRQQLAREPDCNGGFGFDTQREPHAGCPSCGGLGSQRAIFADTTKLTGAAAILYKGVKQTASGIEMITHDVDKARDRLYRAFGMYGDDAASVARAAAAGSAAGAAMGRQAKQVLDAMSPEDAARTYLEASQ
jgi:phage terminase small subunit